MRGLHGGGQGGRGGQQDGAGRAGRVEVDVGYVAAHGEQHRQAAQRRHRVQEELVSLVVVAVFPVNLVSTTVTDG